MKNIDVLFMINSGMLDITNNDLGTKSAYKIVKFRSALSKAFMKIQELEKSILLDCGIKNAKDFDEEYKRLKAIEVKTQEENFKFEEMSAKYQKYNKTRAAMLDDDIVLENVTPIPYEDWHLLRKENRPKKDGDVEPLNNYIESVLENIL